MGHVTEEELGLEMGWVLLPGGAIHKILGSCTSVAPMAVFGEMSDGGVHGVGWCGGLILYSGELVLDGFLDGDGDCPIHPLGTCSPHPGSDVSAGE